LELSLICTRSLHGIRLCVSVMQYWHWITCVTVTAMICWNFVGKSSIGKDVLAEASKLVSTFHLGSLHEGRLRALQVNADNLGLTRKD
jgi:hypothetical protein